MRSVQYFCFVFVFRSVCVNLVLSQLSQWNLIKIRHRIPYDEYLFQQILAISLKVTFVHFVRSFNGHFGALITKYILSILCLTKTIICKIQNGKLFLSIFAIVAKQDEYTETYI